MLTWGEFSKRAPELAAIGQRLFADHRLAYLATSRRDGSPRLHPITPVETATGMYVAVNHESPKRWDLQRDRRYVLHAPLGASDEEFVVSGEVRRISDPAIRMEISTAAGHTIHDTDWLFEFLVETCLRGYWVNAGQPGTFPVRQHWQANETS
jgi:Pyridoxamine 5'-phosphate oxidase